MEKASNLVDKPWPFLLVKCRYVAKKVEQVIWDIGRSLAVVFLGNTELLSRISNQVNRLHSDMQRVECEASQSQLNIVDN